MSFTDKDFAVYCWTNCRIFIKGTPHNVYQSGHTPMSQYLMAHNLINEKRKQALVSNKIGPKILITGSNASGKTTLCHILLNYAIKLGWTPVYVDLDLSNEISVPGAISSTIVDFVVPNDYMIDNSISLFHGNLNNDINFFLYEKQINEMAKLVNSKLNAELQTFKKKYNLNDSNKDIYVSSEIPTVYASGAIINCPTINKDTIYKTIINDFDCEYVFVLENERLYNDLTKYYKSINSGVNICLLSKSRGVVNHDTAYKEAVDQKRFTQYFKGPYNNLRLNEFTLDMNNYKLIHIIHSNVTSALLPIGSTSTTNLIVKEVTIEEENLLNRVIAIPHIDDKILEELDKDFNKLHSYLDYFSKAPVSYFAYIIRYEKNTRSLKIHTSCSEIKHRYLMLGNVKYTNI
jgi:polyribonucleotide 5'-hydroxyl-kinase